jgi:hypothetical protein
MGMSAKLKVNALSFCLFQVEGLMVKQQGEFLAVGLTHNHT